MRRFVYVVLPLASLLILSLWGCHQGETPATTTAPAPADGAVATTPLRPGGKAPAAGSGSLGVNPDYNGPANGGVGAKAGGN
jgi:hypothetical protein